MPLSPLGGALAKVGALLVLLWGAGPQGAAQEVGVRVVDATLGTPVPGAWVQSTAGRGISLGWTDAQGEFRFVPPARTGSPRPPTIAATVLLQPTADSSAVAPSYTDSLRVQALGYRTAVFPMPLAGIEVLRVWPLRFMLPEVDVASAQGSHRDGAGQIALLQPPTDQIGGAQGVLTAAPGLSLYDAGAGILQPVVRGFSGSRITINSGGMPLEGGRWGNDHGMLFEALLWDDVSWVQGVASLEWGAGSGAGALVLRDEALLPRYAEEVKATGALRTGDAQGRAAFRWRSRGSRAQWTVGAYGLGSGDRNVPATQFVYLGRNLPVRYGHLVNTAGFSGQTTFSLHLDRRSGGTHFIRAELGAGRQGLFPGVIGFPSVEELRGDGTGLEARYRMEEPLATSRRAQLSWRMRSAAGRREVTLGWQGQERGEWAPPHAHGWGPLPTSHLALQLREQALWGAVQWRGERVRGGVQVQGLMGRTEGWEFLLPDHRAVRLAGWARGTTNRGFWGVRAEGMGQVTGGHVEPLYGVGGEVLGEDVRAVAGRQRGWGVTARWGREGMGAQGGGWRWETGWVHRLPDVYERTANGLHHGTFRFEQGNPDLRAEWGWVAEGTWSRRWPRAQAGSPGPGGTPGPRASSDRRSFQLTLEGFTGAYPSYIFLAPEARFAPIAHAGQIYAFQQRPVARAGGEWAATWTQRGRGTSAFFLRSQAAVLGAWTLHDGLGLPFTPPLKHELSLGGQDWSRGGWGHWGAGLTYTLRAPSWVLARNEARTPSSQQWGGWISLQRGPAWRWILRITHATDRAYLDHASIYRALELPAQGRLIEWECRWTPALRHGSSAPTPN